MVLAPIEYCIFDCDGLLLGDMALFISYIELIIYFICVDTEEIYFDIGRAVIGKYGKTFEWSLKSRLMGMPWNEAVDLLLETLGLPITREEYIEQAAKHVHLFQNANILPGVERLVSHLKKHNIPISVQLAPKCLFLLLFRLLQAP